MKTKVIIISPSLNPLHNVSGISSITEFIIKNNYQYEYIHFELGRKDNERKNFLRIICILKSLIAWLKLLIQNKNVIVHYNFPLSKASILRDPIFILAAYYLNKRMIIHIHGGVFLSSNNIPKYLKCILNKIFSLRVPFIVLSSLEKEKLQKKFNCKNIFILPNCIDLKDAANFKRNVNYHKTLTIGYLGRIAKSKGMDFLLQACIDLKKKNIPFFLHLAGQEEVKDQYLPLFKSYLQENFTYKGVIFNESKNTFLQEIDIFILPSFFEGLPMSLIECMSYGVVPITTNVGSISEIVQNNINGLFIKVKDSTSITDQISKLYSDRTLLNYLSTNAKNYIFRHFNQENYIKALNNIYSKSYE